MVNVVPAVQANPVRSVVSGAVTYSLSGFSASELVTLRVYKSDSVAIELGSTTVATNGSGLLVSPLPAMPYGGHRVEAIGGSSGAVALSSLVVMPSVTIAPDTVEAGEQVGVALRGFAAGEQVSLQLGSGGQVLATLTASHSGSTSSRTTVVQIPDSVAPGTYPVIAMGATTGASASFELTVAAPAPSEAPVPTPLMRRAQSNRRCLHPSQARRRTRRRDSLPGRKCAADSDRPGRYHADRHGWKWQRAHVAQWPGVI